MGRELQAYGRLLARRPVAVLALCVAAFILSQIGSSLITQGVTDFSDQIPQELESIRAFDYIENEFRSQGSSVIFAVETNPVYAGSGEARDVREPGVVQYMDLLAQKSRAIDRVTRAQSAADLLRQANGGRLPMSERRVIEIIDSAGEGESNPYSAYISDDYSIAAVRISYEAATEDESDMIVRELISISEETSPPPGVKTTLTGGPVTSIVIMEQIGPTFAITGILSYLGILIIVVLVFYSLRYGLTSLLAIVFGSTWAFGFLGFTGFSLSAQTSGALSLILGIGIDFGIQVVTRFRQELRDMEPGKAIARTMPAVIPPMTISALAIFLGFRALSLGNLQFIGELGDIMSLGVLMSYLAAITVVPAVLVILNTKSIKSLAGGKRI